MKYQAYFPKFIYECITEKFMYLKDIAKAMNVNYDTLNEWLKEDSKYFKSELSESYHKALKDKQQRIIEKTQEQLYKTAWGYQYEETKLDGQGNIIYTIKKQAHPNARACIEILQRLSPKEWNTNIQIVEVDKFQEKYNNMTDEEFSEELKKLTDRELLAFINHEKQ